MAAVFAILDCNNGVLWVVEEVEEATALSADVTGIVGGCWALDTDMSTGGGS